MGKSRFEKGFDSYLAALETCRSLFPAQQGLVWLSLTHVVSQLRFYTALGSGEETEATATQTAGR